MKNSRQLCIGAVIALVLIAGAIGSFRLYFCENPVVQTVDTVPAVGVSLLTFDTFEPPPAIVIEQLVARANSLVATSPAAPAAEAAESPELKAARLTHEDHVAVMREGNELLTSIKERMDAVILSEGDPAAIDQLNREFEEQARALAAKQVEFAESYKQLAAIYDRVLEQQLEQLAN